MFIFTQQLEDDINVYATGLKKNKLGKPKKFVDVFVFYQWTILPQIVS